MIENRLRPLGVLAGARNPEPVGAEHRITSVTKVWKRNGVRADGQLFGHVLHFTGTPARVQELIFSEVPRSYSKITKESP